MDVKVAVEKSLTPVKDFLTQKGYTVDSIDLDKEFTKGMDKYDAVVVTGIYENFLGVEDRSTNAAIINAKGLTTEQVYTQIVSKLQ